MHLSPASVRRVGLGGSKALGRFFSLKELSSLDLLRRKRIEKVWSQFLKAFV